MTTLQQYDQEAAAIYQTIMDALRPAMKAERVSWDKADKLADAVYAGALAYVTKGSDRT